MNLGKVKYILIIFLLNILISCGISKKEVYEQQTPNKYILLNNSFNNEIIFQIKKSRLLALKKEKEAFTNRNIDNPTYLKTIENDYYINTGESFFKEEFVSLINTNLKNKKVNSIYFINILFNGESISTYSFVIIEGINSENKLYYYDGYSSERNVNKIISDEIIDFTDEFMLNLPYSFENNALFDSGVQHFTIDKISAMGKNKHEVKSVIVTKMLDYQTVIFKKIYGLRK